MWERSLKFCLLDCSDCHCILFVCDYSFTRIVIVNETLNLSVLFKCFLYFGFKYVLQSSYNKFSSESIVNYWCFLLRNRFWLSLGKELLFFRFIKLYGQLFTLEESLAHLNDSSLSLAWVLKWNITHALSFNNLNTHNQSKASKAFKELLLSCVFWESLDVEIVKLSRCRLEWCFLIDLHRDLMSEDFGFVVLLLSGFSSLLAVVLDISIILSFIVIASHNLNGNKISGRRELFVDF